ncbi:acyltransferase family protein [Dyella flagellata]|uniref:Membrane protein n=1 Tax=Dyella flagellata TaxID=1867833 RepID=A0ABQ5XG97_9GAMM|nr:acyltransferase family protein [Dyella flagellata]GLQ89972.1 membrane protein [Dyella flagellata]
MNRRHDIDALRVLAFGLLILYHSAMLYVAGWDFHLKSSHTASWLQDPMLFLNRWRMELLFLISGLAVNFMRRRGSLPGMAWKRTARLLLPLVFGMLVVIPIQPYVQGLSNHLVQPGFGRFLLRYWTGGPWPAGAFTGWQFGFTWNHLWYLPYLWVYTMLLMPLLESPAGQRLRAAVLQLRGPALLVLPVIPLFVWHLLLAHRYPFTGALWGDWYAHALYFSMFLYGYLMGTDAGIWSELARLRRITLPSALACFALYLAGIRLLPDSAPTVVWWAVHALRYAYLWTAICAVLGWGHAYLNRPFRWLPYAREAVYPWYVLHQSLLLLFAWQLMPLGLGPVAEPVLIIACTIGGCALLHECVIRRVSWLRPLFGMEPMPRATVIRSAPMNLRIADDIA